MYARVYICIDVFRISFIIIIKPKLHIDIHILYVSKGSKDSIDHIDMIKLARQ